MTMLTDSEREARLQLLTSLDQTWPREKTAPSSYADFRMKMRKMDFLGNGIYCNPFKFGYSEKKVKGYYKFLEQTDDEIPEIESFRKFREARGSDVVLNHRGRCQRDGSGASKVLSTTGGVVKTLVNWIHPVFGTVAAIPLTVAAGLSDMVVYVVAHGENLHGPGIWGNLSEVFVIGDTDVKVDINIGSNDRHNITFSLSDKYSSSWDVVCRILQITGK